MFPLFSVLFPVCSQFESAKQRPFPVFRDFVLVEQPRKGLKHSVESLVATGNIENNGNAFDE